MKSNDFTFDDIDKLVMLLITSEKISCKTTSSSDSNFRAFRFDRLSKIVFF